MENNKFIGEINKVLKNEVMPDNVRVLLVEIRDEMFHAKTKEQKMEVFLKWGKLITSSFHYISELDKYF